jgi:hypothetical protein
MSLAQPATGSWPAANPRSRQSRRPTQSSLVSASRYPVGVEDESRGGLAQASVRSEKCSPFRRERLARLLWRGVGGRGSKSQAPEATVVFVASSFESSEARIQAS